MTTQTGKAASAEKLSDNNMPDTTVLRKHFPAARAGLSSFEVPLGDGDGAGVARITVGDVESLGLEVRQFEAECRRSVADTPEQLRERAENLATRVTCLPEPLQLIEADQQQGIVQLRSTQPQMAGREKQRVYFELSLHAKGKLTMTRWSKQPRQPRTPIAAPFTWETLRRFVSEIERIL